MSAPVIAGKMQGGRAVTPTTDQIIGRPLRDAATRFVGHFFKVPIGTDQRRRVGYELGDIGNDLFILSIDRHSSVKDGTLAPWTAAPAAPTRSPTSDTDWRNHQTKLEAAHEAAWALKPPQQPPSPQQPSSIERFRLEQIAAIERAQWRLWQTKPGFGG
jgi:hypothetical protein